MFQSLTNLVDISDKITADPDQTAFSLTSAYKVGQFVYISFSCAIVKNNDTNAHIFTMTDSKYCPSASAPFISAITVNSDNNGKADKESYRGGFLNNSGEAYARLDNSFVANETFAIIYPIRNT